MRCQKKVGRKSFKIRGKQSRKEVKRKALSIICLDVLYMTMVHIYTRKKVAPYYTFRTYQSDADSEFEVYD